MKFTIASTTLLLVTILIGCSDSYKAILKDGHFSSIGFDSKLSREVSSISSSSDNRNASIQLYLNCFLKEQEQVETCYQNHNKKFKDILTYKDITKLFKKLDQEILKALDKNINKYALDRNNFCEKNDKISFNKCLNQFFSKEVIELTNIYQENYSDLNGQEFLYTKILISERYKITLNEYQKYYDSKSLDKISSLVKKSFPNIQKELTSDLAWIKEVKFLPKAHSYCVSYTQNKVTQMSSPSLSSYITKPNNLINDNCEELLSHEAILSELNLYTNKAIEKEVLTLQQKIEKKVTKSSASCLYGVNNDKETLNCINQKIKKEVTEALNDWEENSQQDDFFKNKKDLIKNKIKLSPKKIRRSIASVSTIVESRATP